MVKSEMSQKGKIVRQLVGDYTQPKIQKDISIFGIYIALYNEKGTKSLFDLQFLEVPGIAEEN